MPTVAHLVLVHGAGIIPLAPGENVVGRAHGSDVLLRDLSVSRRHATLAVGEDAATVRDHDSRNGTFVAGERVTVAVLEPGVELAFGGILCTYQRDDDALGFGSTVSGAACPRIDLSGPPARPGQGPHFQVVNPSSTEDASGNEDAPGITAAERRVFDLLVCGRGEKGIAAALGLSRHTVHNHVRRIYRAFGVRSRSELLAHVLGRKPDVGNGRPRCSRSKSGGTG